MAEQKAPMTGEDCVQVIRDLSRSQGSYGRMLEQINSMDDEDRAELLDTFEAQQFTDPVQLVMWLEG